jgi:hypothetical protein
VGTFRYDRNDEVEFGDRTLLHLQIVIGQKLRRGESFYFTWRDRDNGSNGRTTIWIHPAVPITYRYTDDQMPKVNSAWLQLLSDTAYSGNGLQIVLEPADHPRA